MTTTYTSDFTYTDWHLIETRFSPELLRSRETVFTIGNGYLSTRGSFEEGITGELPATLMHGVFDQVPVVYTELANCPDWLPLRVMVNGEHFSLDQGDILCYERRLDLQHGLLSRTLRWRSPSGQAFDFEFERFTSLADQHVVGLRCRITPIDAQTKIEIQVSLNGYAENEGFNHWECLGQGGSAADIWLRVQTRSSKIELGMATRVIVSDPEAPISISNVPGYPTLSTTVAATSGQTVTFEKVGTVFTSRDPVDNPPVQVAKAKLADLPTYDQLRAAHEQAWETVWNSSDIVIEGDVKAQLAVRYNLFQLFNCAPWQDERVSIGAKTLSGFGYRGHAFWDTEIFILPFFTFTQPTVARNLLTYRYHTLNGARRKAENSGYKGAMFPWESADSGDEVTPRWSIPNDPYARDVRIWCSDREIHISADIAYAIWQYWQATNDHDWMRKHGAEIFFDTAVFWSSRVELNTKLERYEIHEVIGADEYHEHQVNNNALTNRLVQWHLEKALLVYDWLKQTFPQTAEQLGQSLGLTPERRDRWRDIVQNLWIPYDPDSGLIEQYDGFFQLKDINLADYEPRVTSMQSVLGIEGANQCQVLKQPDVLMLLYLMRESQEFPYNETMLKRNWDYYTPRTDITYGSSLGPAIHAILASDLGHTTEAYERFMQAALVDLEDVRGNADQGIHAASCGGLWQAVVFGFGGVTFSEQGPVAEAHLPPDWQRLQFKLHWRGVWHQFDLRPGSGLQQGAIIPEIGTMEPIQSSDLNAPAAEIQGVIFDLDGVLTDTAEYHYQAWQQLADEEGFPFDRQANEGLRGLSRRESLLQIVGERQVPDSKLEEMMDRKNRYYVDLIQHITAAQLLPGALALLDELRQQGIKVAIGSGSKNARTILDKLGIESRIDAIADGYSVSRSKPDPDVFLYAAEQLGLKPNQCVVVEDAKAGVEAALAAGMWTVGLGPPERVGIAHLVLPNLAGVHVADLLQGLG